MVRTPDARAAWVVAERACVGPGRAGRAPVVRARGSVVVSEKRVSAHAQLVPRLVRVSRASCFGLAGERSALGVSREVEALGREAELRAHSGKEGVRWS